MAVVIFLCCLLGGIAIGLPIAWSLLLCGAALMAYLDMFDVQIMAQTLVNGADSFSLLAIPFFVLAGEIMNAGGLSKRIVDLPMKLVGHKPGGPAHSDVWMQMLADVSGLRIELPQVEETGCFGAALAARVGTGVYRNFREAQRDLRHPVRTLLPDMAAHALYQRKYRQYQHLIEALQGYHARIKEHAL